MKLMRFYTYTYVVEFMCIKCLDRALFFCYDMKNISGSSQQTSFLAVFDNAFNSDQSLDWLPRYPLLSSKKNLYSLRLFRGSCISWKFDATVHIYYLACICFLWLLMYSYFAFKEMVGCFEGHAIVLKVNGFSALINFHFEHFTLYL